MSTWIRVSVWPDEENDDTCIAVTATNGYGSGGVEMWYPIAWLVDLGNGLRRFPRKVPDEFVLTAGVDLPDGRVGAYFREAHSYLEFRAYTTDASGHCALQIRMNNNEVAPDELRCCFSIAMEPAQLDRLGDLLLRIDRRCPSGFRWTQLEDETTFWVGDEGISRG